MMYGSWDMEREGQSVLSFWVIFCPFTPQFAKSKFWKNEKKTWRYYRFTQVYHKWQSYHAWFLRYRVPRTELFVILNHFLLFNPTKNPENENFEKKKKYNNNNKKMPGDNIILHVYSKWQSYDVSFLRLGAGQTFFVILDHFLPF